MRDRVDLTRRAVIVAHQSVCIRNCANNWNCVFISWFQLLQTCVYTHWCATSIEAFRRSAKQKHFHFLQQQKKKAAIYYHILRLSDELFFVGFAQVTWMRKRYQKPQEESQMQRGLSWELWEVLIFDPNKSWRGMHKERLRR